MAWSMTASGIAAPASVSVSGDANTMDDYQEGTWTPVTNGGWGVGVGSENCDYTLLGRQCNFTGFWANAGAGSGSASTNTNGLPFNVGQPSGLLCTTSGLYGNAQYFYAQRMDGTNNEMRWFTDGGVNCGWNVMGNYTIA